MVIDAKHKIGSVVYLLTDEEQKMRVVTAIIFRSGGLVEYELGCGSEQVVVAVECEIIKTKRLVI